MDNFGKYIIERKIGEGGTATVYLAKETVLNRDVVLKIMSNQQFSGAIDFKKLFIDEAQRIAKLNHPNIIQVYEAGIEDDRIYIAMEYLSGGTLKDRIVQQQSFDPLQVLKDMTKALHYVYQETGTIHRDIKPANIIFRKSAGGQLDAVLTDFGISKTEGVDSDFTSFDMKVGTPRYMSPEQLLGGTIDQRSDLYSLGIVFYEMLVGEKPYDADNTMAVIQSRTRSSTPKLPSEHKKHQKILDKLITPHPDDRFSNAKELLTALDNIKLKKTISKDGEKGIYKPIILGISSIILVTLISYFSYVYYDKNILAKNLQNDIETLQELRLDAERDKNLLGETLRKAKKIKKLHPENSQIAEIYDDLVSYKQELVVNKKITQIETLLKREEYPRAEKEAKMLLSDSPPLSVEQQNVIKDQLILIKNASLLKDSLSKIGEIDIKSSQKQPKVFLPISKAPKITIRSINNKELYFYCLYQSPEPQEKSVMMFYPLPKALKDEILAYKKINYKKLKFNKSSSIEIPISEGISGLANIYCYGALEDIEKQYRDFFEDDMLKSDISLDKVEETISKLTKKIYTKKSLSLPFIK